LDPIINGNIHFRAVRGAEMSAVGGCMATSKIKLRLNQQQIELIDNTIRSGESNSRDDLVRRALREFAKANLPQPEKDK
jgi:ribbon-helix-helix CopG family protein